MNTMTSTCKYIITDTPHLINPAGYNIGDRIFKQTAIAIHCDEIPAKLPRTSGGLYAHDIDEMERKWNEKYGHLTK